MRLQYSDPEAFERLCDEGDRLRDERKDQQWEEQQNKKTMNDIPITKEEASDREMLSLLDINDKEIQRLLAREEMRKSNALLLEATYLTCKTEHNLAQELLVNTDYNHPDWHINNYMSGYHQGRLRMIEHLKAAIQ